MAIELAKAYVQIVPSAEGIQGSIASVLNGEATSAGNSAGKTVGENLAGSMKKALAASGVEKTISGALDANGVLKKNASGIQQVQESLTGAIAKATVLTTAIQTAAAAVKNFVVSAAKTGVQYNAQIETYRTALTNMLGDAEKASAMLDNIKQAAARTPFSTDALVEANQYLLSAGENAEYSQKTILALGDAIKATGGGDAELSRMAQNLQQVANVGKASAVDIKQFAMAGINIYQVLSDYTGKSVQEVQDMTVTYDVLTQALQAAAEEGGRYYGSMETQSETLSGRITTLQDNAKQLAGELTTGLSSAYGTVVEKANEWITSILSNDESLQKLNTTVTAVTAAIAAGTSGFIAYRTAMAVSGVISAVRNATEGMTIAQAALNAVMAANPVAIVVAALAALAGGLATAYAANEDFRKGWNSAWSSIKSVFSTVADFILDKLNRVIAVANGVANALAAIGNGESLNNVINAYNSAYQQARNNYAQSKATKDWDKTHANMEWDEDNGWVPKGTSNSGNGSSRAGKNSITSSVLSSTGGTTSKKAGSSSSVKSVTETLLWSLQDAATSISQNDFGKVTAQTTELTEHLKKGSVEYDRLTKTVTESGKEMVNGVVKNYKTVTKYVTENGKTTAQTQKVYEEIAATVTNTITSTTDTVVNGIATSTKTITETLTDGTEQTKQTITETQNDIINGALVTVETVTNIAADGTRQVAKTIQKASADSFSGLVKGWQTEANKGVLGTFSTLVDAVKKQDWQSIGEWVLSTLYNGLAPENKKLIDDFGNALIRQLNKVLADKAGELSQTAWDIGSNIWQGLTGSFDNITVQTSALAQNLVQIFSSLKAPLAAVSSSISAALSGGLLSQFPTILSAVGGLITSIGGAFTAMLASIGATLSACGIPTGPVMIAAGVALVAALASIVAALGCSFHPKSSTAGSTISGALTGADGTLWDYEQPGSLPQRRQRPNIEVNQYIYSKAQTAADLMREAQYEQERAVLQGV